MADDRMALVSGISLDPEAAIGVTKKLPPKWIEGVDEVSLYKCIFKMLIHMNTQLLFKPRLSYAFA